MPEFLQIAQGEDMRQQQSLRAALGLFAAMLVLTLLARGAAAVTMPRVTVTHPYASTITSTIQTEGVVTPGAGLPFTLPAEVLVEEVYVQSGEIVQEGDALLRLSLTELERKLAKTQAELELLEVRYRQGCIPQEADPYAVAQAQEELLRAYDACHEVYAQGERMVNKARDALDAARASGDGDLIRQAQEALEAAEEQAEQQNKAALAAAQAVEDRRNAEIHSFWKETEALDKANELNRAQASVTLAELAEKRQAADELCALIQADGIYRAATDGTVTRMDCAAGGQSPAVGGLFAGVGQPCVLTFTLERDESALAAPGSPLTVRQGTKEAQAAIHAVSTPDENGSVCVTVHLDTAGWNSGSAQITLRLGGGSWPQCLPLGAVQTDSSGNYVYKLEQRSTVLGMQDVVVRVPLTVERIGDGLAAVTGSLSGHDRVVSGSDKPLQSGVKVQIDEG